MGNAYFSVVRLQRGGDWRGGRINTRSGLIWCVVILVYGVSDTERAGTLLASTGNDVPTCTTGQCATTYFEYDSRREESGERN